MIKKIKILFLLYTFFTLFNCNSLQKQLIGTWKLTAEINSDNPYATRSSLKETKVEIKKELILNRDSTFVSNLSLCNQWPPSDSYISKGVYHFKRNRNPDKLFWLECPDMYRDHYFILKDKNLELYLPSVTGYRIQIFEKVTP